MLSIGQILEEIYLIRSLTVYIDRVDSEIAISSIEEEQEAVNAAFALKSYTKRD